MRSVNPDGALPLFIGGGDQLCWCGGARAREGQERGKRGAREEQERVRKRE